MRLSLATSQEGIRFRVKLTPKASRNRIEGLALEADGGVILKVSVTAIPENGKANDALIALLAKEWKLGKGRFTILSGHTDRRKLIEVSGCAQDLGAALEQWIECHVRG